MDLYISLFPVCYMSLSAVCPCPPYPVNGYIASCVGSALVGNYIHYYCDSGYERVGDFSRKCQVGDTWTGSTPICEKSKSDWEECVKLKNTPQLMLRRYVKTHALMPTEGIIMIYDVIIVFFSFKYILQ